VNAGAPKLAAVLEAARSRHAEELVVLDVARLAGFTETFVICHGGSSRQVQTIAEAIIEALEGPGHRILHVEGMSRAEWILIDAGDLVVHVFQRDRRRFYALERLWAEAPRLELPAS